MMKLAELIEGVDGWRELPTLFVWDKLNEKTVQFVDGDWWSLLGLANIIGAGNVKPFIDYLDSIGLGWVGVQAAGRGVPIGNAEINTLLLSLNRPDANAIAQAGRRMVSPLEFHGLKLSYEIFSTALAGLKLGAIKREKKALKSQQYNLDIAAIENWDGNPDTEPN